MAIRVDDGTWESSGAAADAGNRQIPGETEQAAITAHKTGLVPTNLAALGFRGSFWSFCVGAKKYF